MLGAILLYVGVVLIVNGIGRLTKIDPKATAVMNLFTGALSVIMNFGTLLITQAGVGLQSGSNSCYYTSATGLLFGFTYLFIGINSIFNLEGRAYGWYCLFVTITTVPAGLISWGDGKNIYNILMALIWWAWGVLWLTGWIELVLKKELKFTPYLSILEGVFTAWIPGFLILLGIWK